MPTHLSFIFLALTHRHYAIYIIFAHKSANIHKLEGMNIIAETNIHTSNCNTILHTAQLQSKNIGQN